MTTRRGGARFLRDQRGVAQVIGAVLLLALITSLFVVVRTEHVPVWEQEAEADQMAAVMAGFADLRIETDRLITNRSADRADVALPMAHGPTTPVFGERGEPARVRFGAAAGPVAFQAPELRITMDNGVATFDADEQWVPVPLLGALVDVAEIQHLRLRIIDPARQPDGASATLRVVDVGGLNVGSLAVYVERFPSGYTIKTRVLSATGGVLYDQGESFFNQDRPSHYWIDALRSEAQFGNVLSSARGPLAITFLTDRIAAEYSIAYQSGAATGGSLIGTAGTVQTDWVLERAGGAIVYETNNRYHPDRQIIYEHGALLLVQADGAVMRGAPRLDIETVGTTTTIRADLPGLRGATNTVTGSGPSTIALEAGERRTLTATAPQWSLQVPTSHPDVWAVHWQDEVGAVLNEARGEFQIATGTDWARLTIYGTTPGPSSTLHDLILEMRTATLDVRLST